jgi:hypothetical protein
LSEQTIFGLTLSTWADIWPAMVKRLGREPEVIDLHRLKYKTKPDGSRITEAEAETRLANIFRGLFAHGPQI